MATFPTSAPWVSAAPQKEVVSDGMTGRDIHLIAMSLSMSGGAGIRASMPLFMLSLFHNLAPAEYPLFEPLSFLGEQEMCAILGVIVLVEVVVDSIPALDHALHLILTPAHPFMGALVACAPGYYGGWTTRLPVAAAGALLALAVHAAKVALRAASSGCSCGTLNPVVSVCETALGVGLVAISTLHPALAALVIIGFICLAFAGLQNAKQALYPDGFGASEGNSPKADGRQALYPRGSNAQTARGPPAQKSQYRLAIRDEETGPRMSQNKMKSLC